MYYRVALACICMSIAQLYGQVKDEVMITFNDGEHSLQAADVVVLESASETFKEDLLTARNQEKIKAPQLPKKLSLLELSYADFQFIIQMITKRDTPSALSILIQSKKYTLDQLYQLYEQLTFLDISSLREFMKEYIQEVIAQQPQAALNAVDTTQKEEWFVDRVNQISTLPSNVYVFIVQDGVVTKPLAQQQSVEALINASEMLKAQVQFTSNTDLKKPLRLLNLTKKEFEDLYTLITLDNEQQAKKLAAYSLLTLSSLADKADYLGLQALFTLVIKQLAQKMIQKNALLRFKESDQLVDSLRLNASLAHQIALAISNQLAIRTQRYLFNTLTGHTSKVLSVAFSPDGTMLASGSDDKTIKLWDVNSGKLLKTLKGHTSIVESVAYSSDGRTVASGSWDKTIKLWDVASGNLLKTLAGHADWVFSVAFSPDEKMLASGLADGTIELWNVVSGKLINTLAGHSNYVNSVAFSPDGKTLASGSTDNTIKLWDVVNGKLIKTLTGHIDDIKSITFSPDGSILASGSDDKTIKLWNVISGKLIKTLTGHSNYVNSIAFSPDGTMLASGSEDTTIKLWDIVSYALVNTLKGHTGHVTSVVFSSDDKTLASGSYDKTIKLWRIITLNDLRNLTLDQALMIALAQQEHNAGRSLVLTQRLATIFASLNEPVKKLLVEVFNVRGGK